jgi:hypothetical protein
MRLIDFSSWQGVLSTLTALVIVTVIAVGIRLLVMQRVQNRRERQNRQINERLKTLIAAYKTLGGSFMGDLGVDPAHLRDQRMRAAAAGQENTAPGAGGSERSRRVRDAVEAALSDVMLLGTADQVRLAAQAATDMAAGRKIETAELVQSLRYFIREVLDLDAVPADLVLPKQGRFAPGRVAGEASPRARDVREPVAGSGDGSAASGMLGLGLGATQSPHDTDASEVGRG